MQKYQTCRKFALTCIQTILLPSYYNMALNIDMLRSFVRLRFISLLILYTITYLREDGNQKRETIDISDVFLMCS